MLKLMPLIVGVVLLLAAVGGAAYSMLAPAPRAPKAAAKRQIKEQKPAPEPKISAAEQARIDEANIRRIIFDHIDQIPKAITDEWLSSLCRFLGSEVALKAHLAAAVERGSKFDVGYTADFKARNPRKVMSEDPRTYITLSRNLIYKPNIKPHTLKTRARGLLDMALYRELLLAEGNWDEVRDAILESWYKTTLRLYKTLNEIALEQAEDRRLYHDDIVRCHEAIVTDRHYRIQRGTAQARKRFTESRSSARAATQRIGTWRKTLNAHLLALGELYIEAAAAETTYKGRQQDNADRGFKALAMLYQIKKSPEALKILKEANRIQRYNLWKMGQAHWSKAKRAAAAAGKHELAEEHYLQGKRRYLQALVRIEESKKKRVYTEFRTLQQEISAWRKTSADRALKSGDSALKTSADRALSAEALAGSAGA